MLFSIVAVPIYTPTNSAQGFPFPHTLASTCYAMSYLFENNFSNRCEVIPRCGFDLYSPDMEDLLYSKFYITNSKLCIINIVF